MDLIPKPAEADRLTVTGLELFQPLPFGVGEIDVTVMVGSELSLTTCTLALALLTAVQLPYTAVTV